jgi:fatty acid amide hydrolase 2
VLSTNAVLLFPSHPTVAPFHTQPICQPFNYIYTGLFNSLALPAAVVPLGLNADGLPVSVQVCARTLFVDSMDC